MPRERLKHSPRLGCPSCGGEGKVRRKRSGYVVFICPCGVTISAPDKEALKEKLKDASKVSTMRLTNLYGFRRGR